MKMLTFCIFLFIGCVLYACIDEVELHIRSEAPRLVVEGMITNEPTPYTVRLTYSGDFESVKKIPQNLLVNNATVTIADDTGNSTQFYPQGEGIYQTEDPLFVGQVGRTYQLTVELAEGKKYISQPEKMLPVPLIDSLYSEFVGVQTAIDHIPGFRVYADIKDPESTENYYRWIGFSYIRKHSTGLPGGFAGPCCDNCWVPNYGNENHILSDVAVNGNLIQKQEVYFSPVFESGSHLVEISQLSLTQSVYQFWKNYQQQQSRTGSIADPLPTTVTGNVTNADDANEFALGYFSVSAVSRKRLNIINSLTRYEIDFETSQYAIPEGDCRVVFPGGQFEKPTGW